MRTAVLLILVLIAFAGNSILARLSLSGENIGPWGFSLIRFVSGAAMLLIISQPKLSWTSGNWGGALALCLYGVCFSFAYLDLAAGTGALLLFASVQITMLVAAYSRGERLSGAQGLGLFLAAGGLIYLLAPSAAAPSLIGAALMIVSGIGWGLYSLIGAGAGDARLRTTGNFSRAAIILVALSPAILMALPEAPPTPTGIYLGIVSGTVTSALGYMLWYFVLRNISVTTAAISQLSVPVIAAIGGAIFIFEPVTWSFGISCGVVLAGVGIATLPRA